MGLGLVAGVRELAEVVIVRPRRWVCVRCACTHVLLPELQLALHADTAAVIGAAVAAKAIGLRNRSNPCLELASNHDLGQVRQRRGRAGQP